MILLLLLAQEASGLAQELEYANAPDRPQFHVQAVRKLHARGAAAVAEEVVGFVAKRGRNALSLEFTEGLGGLKDVRLTKLLRELAADRDFFWRPAAMRSLAAHADPAALEDFRGGLADRLWGVRVAAIVGLEKLSDRASLPRIRERLNDGIYDVRAQAAKSLHAFGDDSGLPMLVASLRARAWWFEIDYGQIAREDAWRFLKQLSGDDFGYKPWAGEATRAEGLAKFEAWMSRRMPDWRERVPERARPSEGDAEYVFGFELRSCQKGDFYFRIGREGDLVLGFFNLTRAKLSADELSRFNAALERVKRVDRSAPYGRGGCDFEQYYLRVDGGFEKLWVGLGGRPPEMDGWNKVVAELLRAKFGDREASEFREVSSPFRAPE